jgi:RimJ/RimL family protein N-acetyltransferase
VTAVLPELDAQLSRAGQVHVRQARPEDRPALAAMHERLSLRSRYLRYFTGAPNVELDIQRLLRPTDDDHETVVALIDGQLVAVGCYERLDDLGVAEVAFLVDDEHQGRGLGTLLLGELAELAAARGIRRLVAETLPANSNMLHVFRDCGLRHVVTAGRDTIRVEIPLDDDVRALTWREIAHTVLDPPAFRVDAHEQ